MIGLLVWTALALAAADDSAGKKPLADEVGKLVRQLNAAQLSQRDEAERKLSDLGADVLPLLPTIDDQTPAEVAMRVTRMQQKLLRARAAAAAGPSLVTLKGVDLPLADVLRDLSKQTGNPIIDQRDQPAEMRVKADFDKTPFWQALDNVLDQAELTLYGFSGQRGAFVVTRPPDAAPRAAKAFYAGMFRLQALRFEALRDLRNDNAGSLKFFLEITWEPRLQPFAILQPLGQVKALGNSGEAIAVANAEAEPEALIREGLSATELEIPFELPARNTEKISSLKGKLLALVPGPVQDFRFQDVPVATRQAPARRVEQRKGGATVTLDQVRKNNDVWEVALRVKIEGPSTALESHRGWILENEAFFEDAMQQKVEPAGIEQTLQSRDEVGVNYFFDLKQGPQKLTFVYRTPITVLEVPVEYEFRDLRLP